jgi:hypothetical protein
MKALPSLSFSKGEYYQVLSSSYNKNEQPYVLIIFYNHIVQLSIIYIINDSPGLQKLIIFQSVRKKINLVSLTLFSYLLHFFRK